MNRKQHKMDHGIQCKTLFKENIGETHQDKTIGNWVFNKSAKHRHQKQMPQMG